MTYSPGPLDRITSDDSDDNPEVLDEVVLTGVNVHLERLDVDAYYLNIYGSDDPDDLIVSLNIRAGKKPRRCEVTLSWGQKLELIPEVLDA